MHRPALHGFGTNKVTLSPRYPCHCQNQSLEYRGHFFPSARRAKTNFSFLSFLKSDSFFLTHNRNLLLALSCRRFIPCSIYDMNNRYTQNHLFPHILFYPNIELGARHACLSSLSRFFVMIMKNPDRSKPHVWQPCGSSHWLLKLFRQ